MSRPRVLVGFAESLAAVESAWCLRDAGFEVVAFSRPGRRPALAAAHGVRVLPIPAPESDLAAAALAVAALIRAERPSAVLPLDDAALLVLDRVFADDEAAPGGRTADTAPSGRTADATAMAGPAGAALRLALDKTDQLRLARKAGFAVPDTAIAEPDSSPAEPLPGAGPWMVKCALAVVERDGRLVRPAGRIARDPADVVAATAEIGAPALVQPLVDGVGEGLFGYAAGGELFALSAHRRIRMMNPRGSGSSACQSIPVDPALVEPARQFLAAAGWHGIFMLELLRDEAGRAWFMELNGRSWGSMALARHRGLPYPEWAVRGALDPAFRPPEPAEAPHLTCRHLGREIVHLVAVMRGGRGPDAGRWPKRGATLAAMLRPRRDNRWYHARRGEAAVFARDTWQTVAAQLRRPG